MLRHSSSDIFHPFTKAPLVTPRIPITVIARAGINVQPCCRLAIACFDIDHWETGRLQMVACPWMSPGNLNTASVSSPDTTRRLATALHNYETQGLWHQPLVKPFGQEDHDILQCVSCSPDERGQPHSASAPRRSRSHHS